MALEWKSSEDRLADKLKSEIRVLVIELEHADWKKIPQFWLLGSKLAAIEADLDEKIVLAKGSNYYYRSIRIFKHFSTLERAKAYPGSLRQVLQEARKGIMSRGVSPVRYPAAAKNKSAAWWKISGGGLPAATANNCWNLSNCWPTNCDGICNAAVAELTVVRSFSPWSWEAVLGRSLCLANASRAGQSPSVPKGKTP